jgi:hypothetical protein
MPTKRKSFTIKRSEWIRGSMNELSQLLSPDSGKMCCLGFYLRSCGMKKRDISDHTEPSDVITPLPKQAQWLSDIPGRNSDAAKDLINVNDDDTLKWNTREAEIKELFAQQNIDVIFVP